MLLLLISFVQVFHQDRTVRHLLHHVVRISRVTQGRQSASLQLHPFLKRRLVLVLKGAVRGCAAEVDGGRLLLAGHQVSVERGARVIEVGRVQPAKQILFPLILAIKCRIEQFSTDVRVYVKRLYLFGIRIGIPCCSVGIDHGTEYLCPFSEWFRTRSIGLVALILAHRRVGCLAWLEALGVI